MIKLTEQDLKDIIKNTVKRIEESNYDRHAQFDDYTGEPIDQDQYINSYEYAVESLLNGNITQFKSLAKDYDMGDFMELVNTAVQYYKPEYTKLFLNNFNVLYPGVIPLSKRHELAEKGLMDYPDAEEYEYDDEGNHYDPITGDMDESVKMNLRKSIINFLNEDGATAAGGGATTSFNVGSDAGNNGAGNGFEYDVPLGSNKKNKGGTVMRRTFWTAGNTEKTMQSVDDESNDVINKRKK